MAYRRAGARATHIGPAAAPSARVDSPAMTTFRERYGRWAVVAGASEGLGAAFGHALAARGCDVVLLARREAALADVAASIRARHGVEVETRALDLADPALAARLGEVAAGRELGVAVYNAAYSFIGPLLAPPLSEALRVVDVNCRGPLVFAHALVPSMVERRRGALVLMSSLAGFQGAPGLATYAASKAFTTVLGESLASELRPQGVDVLVSAAGAIRTPSYLRTTKKEAPGTLSAEAVAERTLSALGARSLLVPGAVNQVARFVLGRVLPRSSAVGIMERSTRDLSNPDPVG